MEMGTLEPLFLIMIEIQDNHKYMAICCQKMNNILLNTTTAGATRISNQVGRRTLETREKYSTPRAMQAWDVYRKFNRKWWTVDDARRSFIIIGCYIRVRNPNKLITIYDQSLIGLSK